MPRSARASAGGYCYHVINRGNARAEVFHKQEDLAAFLRIMGEAGLRVPMRVVAYCLMPNHFHLVLWPRADGDLSRWMHWLLTTHVRRYLRPLRAQRPCLARALQSVPHSAGRALVDRDPLRGTQPATCRTGRAVRVEMVEPGAGCRRASPATRDRFPGASTGPSSSTPR